MRLSKLGLLSTLLSTSMLSQTASADASTPLFGCDSKECVSSYKEIKRSTSTVGFKARVDEREAMHILANMHLHGYGTQVDNEKAERLLRSLSAGSSGSDFLKIKYALHTLFNEQGKQDKRLAMKRLNDAAEDGSAEANLVLALLHENGIKLDQNSALAADYFSKAKALGVDVDDDLLSMEREAHRAILDELHQRYSNSVFDLTEVEYQMAQNASPEALLGAISEAYLKRKKAYYWSSATASVGGGDYIRYVHRRLPTQ